MFFWFCERKNIFEVMRFIAKKRCRRCLLILVCCLLTSAFLAREFIITVFFKDAVDSKMDEQVTTLRQMIKESGVRPKKFLLYTALFGSRPWWSVPSNFSFTHHDKTPCDIRACTATYDRSQFDDSDAIIFHARDIADLNLKELRELRSRDLNKIWIWLMHESPVWTDEKNYLFTDLFNWTITYRPDSTIYMPYYDILKIKSNEARPKLKTNFAAQKSKFALALVSNCKTSPRLKLVKYLNEHMQLDVYGSCQSQIERKFRGKCVRFSKECDKELIKYKFYLAFENCLCKDYLTEKYYEMGLIKGLVPVVLNGADMNNHDVAIPNSYINIRDFKNSDSLIEYLNYLDKNDTAYNEYHQWRQHLRVNNSINFMCGACKRIWEDHFSPKSNTVDLKSFWGRDKNCPSYEEFISKFIPSNK